MITTAAAPASSPSSFAEAPSATGTSTEGYAVVRPWWAHLAWVLGASILGFVVPAVFAGALHLSRALFVLPYLAVSATFLYMYVRWSGVDVYRRLRRHWVWGVVGAIAAGAFVVNNVSYQPVSAAPTGVELVGAILWLGVVYGTIDALMLSLLPLFATWQALAGLGWTKSWYGRRRQRGAGTDCQPHRRSRLPSRLPRVPQLQPCRSHHRKWRDESRVVAHDEPRCGHWCPRGDAYRRHPARSRDHTSATTALLSG